MRTRRRTRSQAANGPSVVAAVFDGDKTCSNEVAFGQSNIYGDIHKR